LITLYSLVWAFQLTLTLHSNETYQPQKYAKQFTLLPVQNNIAAAEHGLKILAMLYLTPIAPLGPLSYMSGTTSMALSHFALAKVASLPIMMLYVFIGASAGALVAASSRDAGHLEENAHKLEENPVLILSGVVISVVMISTISYTVKKELFKVSTEVSMFFLFSGIHLL